MYRKKSKKERKKREKSTHKTTTFPSEHWTPNHEQGSTSPSSSFQFAKAPKGSLSTLSLKLKSAKPAQEKQPSLVSIFLHCLGTQTVTSSSNQSHTFIIQTPAKTQILNQQADHHHTQQPQPVLQHAELPLLDHFCHYQRKPSKKQSKPSRVLKAKSELTQRKPSWEVWIELKRQMSKDQKTCSKNLQTNLDPRKVFEKEKRVHCKY